MLWSIFPASAESTRREAVTILLNTLKHKEKCLLHQFPLTVDKDIDLTFFYSEKRELRQTRMNRSRSYRFCSLFLLLSEAGLDVAHP